MAEDVSGIVSTPMKQTDNEPYEQVVTTAFSFNSARHLRELHLNAKSMLLLSMGCG
jgi:hypothetical protein